MISSRTQTNTLDKATRRHICLLVAEWCAQNLGTSYRGVPKIRVIKSQSPNYYGAYNAHKSRHEIVIYYDVCTNVRKLIATLIHEWTHSLQKVRKSYSKLYQEFGDDNHPMEIEARFSEKLWSSCWKEIKCKI